jgi:hypothetical protein
MLVRWTAFWQVREACTFSRLSAEVMRLFLVPQVPHSSGAQSCGAIGAHAHQSATDQFHLSHSGPLFTIFAAVRSLIGSQARLSCPILHLLDPDRCRKASAHQGAEDI